MAVQGQFHKQSESATVVEALATVATIPCANMERMWVTLTTSNNAALDQFSIQVKSNADATAVNAYNGSTDFTSPSGAIVDASGDLTALSADSTGWFAMDVRGIYQVIIQAARAGAGGDTTLTIEIGGN